MKYVLQLLLIMAFFGGYSQTETPEQALIKLEDLRLKAIISRDSITLSSLYDAAYRGTLTNGRDVTKAEVIEFQLANNPNIKITIENVQPSVHGNVGIVTGKQVNRSKSGTILGRSKFMRVYLKKDNTWKIIYSQGTLTAEDGM